ncbi:MAG TPA: hypothetical protein VJS64_10505 [Pyrinomonadaceae bacterium]|nr:hypothetical protein [Pyrinomonadaceae bacterium]
MRIRAIVFFACLVFLPAVHGQDGRSSTGGRREDAFQRKLRRAVELEIVETALGREPRATSDRDPQLILAEIKEDFWRVQVVNIEIVRALTREGALDLRFVAKSAGEIKVRAGRLKENLPLPKSTMPRPNYSQADGNTQQLRSSLTELCNLIVEFVNNPMHKEARVVDTNLSVKASEDLEKIVRLSDHVRKSAGLLRRTGEKSR